jgi:hypothetical protein
MCGGRIRKLTFVKDNVARNNSATRGEIVAPVSFLLARVAEEGTTGGARLEFVYGDGG